MPFAFWYYYAYRTSSHCSKKQYKNSKTVYRFKKKDDGLALINDIYTLIEHVEKIDTLFDKFNRKKDLKNKLFFDGEIYDSYSLLASIINKANSEIIIIDNYVNKELLNINSMMLEAYLKDLGNKIFDINKINDCNYVNELINKIKTLVNN